MRPEEAAELLRKKAVPWDDLRAARVQRRVLAEVRSRGEAPRSRPVTRRLAWALAAAVLIGALVGIGVWPRSGVSPARLDFADGSFVLLDASARVVADAIGADRIEVRQSAGSATYEVTPRPERVFVVWMDDVRVEVLGTVFRVEAVDKAVRVSVQRGHVRVSRGSRTVSLVAGEEVTLGDSDPGLASTTEAGAAPPKAGAPPGGATGSDDRGPASAGATGSDAPGSAATATGGDAPGSAPTATGVDAPGPAAPSSSTGSDDRGPGAAPSGTTTASDDPGPAELFRRADSARAAGNTTEALRLLNLLVARHPKDGRVTLAVFTIGRLQSQRGEHARAAATFESLGSALGGEALAEAALSYAAAGQSGKAKTLALQYASRFPEGPRARQIARLAE